MLTNMIDLTRLQEVSCSSLCHGSSLCHVQTTWEKSYNGLDGCDDQLFCKYHYLLHHLCKLGSQSFSPPPMVSKKVQELFNI